MHLFIVIKINLCECRVILRVHCLKSLKLKANQVQCGTLYNLCNLLKVRDLCIWQVILALVVII